MVGAKTLHDLLDQLIENAVYAGWKKADMARPAASLVAGQKYAKEDCAELRGHIIDHVQFMIENAKTPGR